MPVYLNNLKPDFTPRKVSCGSIPCYQFDGNLASELKAKKITKQQALDLFEDMFIVREFEEMIVKLRSGAYAPLDGFNYRGPTHVSIGQEGASTGACYGIAPTDYITSTHRGHGDSIAKGCVAIRALSKEALRARVPEFNGPDSDLLEAVLEDHIYRTAAELFGKEDGYCKGRGGGMHIADFTLNHLGSNAIVGGGVPIATGAAMACRYFENGGVVCCFAGDGAYGNGVVLESLNWAAMGQFIDERYAKTPFGTPIIFTVLNNHYGMTGRADAEVNGVEILARRAAGFADNNMHAELVNGMNPLAVRDALSRAAEGCRAGKGPYFLELNTYRYYGHSLSDPRNEYRLKDEEAAWRAIDPIITFEKELIDAKVATAEEIEALKNRVIERNAKASRRAADSPDPKPEDVIKYMYTTTKCDTVPAEFDKVDIKTHITFNRTNGLLNYKDAIKEAVYEEMARDSRVILYGEDVAEYGGAFKATKSLLEAFGRNRVFNSPISEASICGTAVGASMAGLRPVVELMYMDFALMASDQISNQASKWHYMSGANIELPLVVRVSVGGGKGYGGQHSQTLESMFAHIPGLYVVYPATPYDAKGMLKSAIRDNNPVMFVESQILYGKMGEVPESDYLVPLGVADVKKEGKDVTLVTWGPALGDALKAADILADEGVDTEVIDLRSLVPLDMETVLKSVRKTGKCVVASHAIYIGGFTGEIASTIMAEAFDYLDAPVLRVGAKNGIAPQSHILEAEFLPNENDMLEAIRKLF